MRRKKQILRLLMICALYGCALTGCKGEDSSQLAQSADSLQDISTTASSGTTTEITTTTAETTTTTTQTTTEITTTATTQTTTQETSSETQSEIETTVSSYQSAVTVSNFVGIWNCTSVEQNGRALTLSECFDVDEEVFIDLVVYADGTFVITLSLDHTPVSGTWTEANGTAVFTAMELPINGVTGDGQLTLYDENDKMFFVKQE